jgi:tRNA threonylcarbamoyladenosine biosynthesis protein TsaE
MELVAHLRSENEAETEALGEALGRLLEPGLAIGLVGELGAGKTCFARGVARGLGVDPSIRVASPTFTLVNEHQGRLTLHHIDLYRLGDPDELVEIGLDDCLRSDGVCLIEWLDRFPTEAPAERIELWLAFEEEESRRIEVRAAGEAPLRVARAWASLPPPREV